MIKNTLNKLSKGKNLTAEEAGTFIELIAYDEVTPSQIGAFILGITAKNCTVEELTGIVHALRKFAVKVDIPNAVCPCGTGSDNSGSFNISTASAILAASEGSFTIAKHANCAISSNCGSSNVLEELGVKLAQTPKEAQEQAQNNNITFLHSPFFNTAVSKINPIRRELGIRTLFNFTGPLINPARPAAQAFGASSVSMAEKMIEVMKNTDSKKAMIFVGIDPKLDEISICGETKIFCLNNGIVEKFSISPEDFGIKRVPLDAIKGSTASKNAEIIKGIFSNEIKNSCLDAVAINTAAIFWAADRVQKLEEGLSLSYNLIEKGFAQQKLKELQCQKVKINL